MKNILTIVESELIFSLFWKDAVVGRVVTKFVGDFGMIGHGPFIKAPMISALFTVVQVHVVDYFPTTILDYNVAISYICICNHENIKPVFKDHSKGIIIPFLLVCYVAKTLPEGAPVTGSGYICKGLTRPK